MSYPAVTIATIGGGAFPELFREAMSLAMENIMDQRYKQQAKRTITFTIVLEPGEDREVLESDITYAFKPAPRRPIKSELIIDERVSKPGHFTLRETRAYGQAQMPLFDVNASEETKGEEQQGDETVPGQVDVATKKNSPRIIGGN